MLRYENNTAFTHTLWDRFEFLSLLEKSEWLKNRDLYHRVENKYSIVQDGFYSLLGCYPLYHSENETLMFWHKLVDKPWFRELQKGFSSGMVGQLISLKKLTLILEEGIEDDEEKLQEILQDNSMPGENDEESEGKEENQGQGESNENNNGEGNEDSDGDSDGETTMDPKDIGPQGKKLSLPPDTVGKRMSEGTQQEIDITESVMPYAGTEKVKDTLEEATEITALFDVKRMAKMMGWVKDSIKAVHRTGDAVSGSMTGYKNVEWDANIHPVDRMGIAVNDPRALIKIGESSLRARRYENKKPKGRGPVIFMRDESGSMRGDLQKTRELEFSMAVAFNAEKRDLVAIAWDNHRTRTHVYGEGSPYKHLSNFFDGGTMIYHALEEGIDRANEYVKGADIVVLTDGDISHERPTKAQQEKIDQYKKKGGRIWVILVGQPYNLNIPWSDGSIKLDDIEKTDALSKLLTEVNRRELVGGRKRL